MTGNKKGFKNYRFFPTIVLLLGIVLHSQFSNAQTDSLFSSLSLKKLSLEELMDIEVTSVSKRPEKLREVASAIQVITNEHIRASGAKTLAEALRLASNLQVAQVNSSQWAISGRGFNNVLANKLLVLLDGRVVYTPLYAGVFWDVQNVILEDIDRIEVISGPGGTLWGSNAVNGVINIISRSSAETKGFFAEAATGTGLPVLGSVRYGGNLGKEISYRVYGTGFKMGSASDSMGAKSNDEWPMLKGGFRMDWATGKNKLVLEGNVYRGEPNPDAADTAVIAKGDNVRVRWNHTISERSDFQLQTYYDHTSRDFGNGFAENLKTFDLDWQHRYNPGSRHALTYGLGFRLMHHQVTNLELFAFLPADKTLRLYNAYVQDNIRLSERLNFILGIKAEHNSYTGFEYQPNARISWTPNKKQNLWAAVSRAVRTPARIDRDFFLLIAPNLPLIAGNDAFESETLIAYEIGWRSQPMDNLTFSLSAFYNVYDNLRSAEPGAPPLFIPITFGNGVKGNSYGLEMSVMTQINHWWNLRGGYTFLNKELELKPGSLDANNASAESNDPRHQFMLQSSIKLPGAFDLGTVFRFVDKLPQPYVSSYSELDIRLARKIGKIIELNIVAQNLLAKRHLEFIPSSPAAREIERSIYGKIICRF